MEEEEDPFIEELLHSKEVLAILDSPLPAAVESLLKRICSEQSQEPPDVEVRRRLAAVGEDAAMEVLKIIADCPIKKSLSGFIIHLLGRDNRSPISTRMKSEKSPNYYSPMKSEDNSCTNCTPHKRTVSFRCFSAQGNTGSTEGPSFPKAKRRLIFCNQEESNEGENSQRISQQTKLISQLEFRKIFVTMSYIGSKKLEDVISVGAAADILKLNDLPMAEFESRIWNDYGRKYYEGSERIKHFNEHNESTLEDVEAGLKIHKRILREASVWTPRPISCSEAGPSNSTPGRRQLLTDLARFKAAMIKQFDEFKEQMLAKFDSLEEPVAGVNKEFDADRNGPSAPPLSSLWLACQNDSFNGETSCN